MGKIKTIAEELCNFWVTKDPVVALTSTLLTLIAPFLIISCVTDLLEISLNNREISKETILLTTLFTIIFIIFLYKLTHISIKKNIKNIVKNIRKQASQGR